MTYYIVENNERRGPFTIEQLATINISADTLVWAEGMDTWKKAEEIDVLRALIISHNSGKAQAESSNMPDTYTPEPPTLPKQQRSWIGRHWKLAVFLLLIAGIIATAYFSCPKKEAHQEALTQLADEVVKNEMNKLTAGIGTTIAQSLVKGVVENFYDDAFTTRDYKLFSVTKFDMANHDDIVAVGAFGHVFTANKDVVTNVVEEKIKEVVSSRIDNLKRFMPSNILKELYDTFVGNIINEFIGGSNDDSKEGDEV